MIEIHKLYTYEMATRYSKANGYSDYVSQINQCLPVADAAGMFRNIVEYAPVSNALVINAHTEQMANLKNWNDKLIAANMKLKADLAAATRNAELHRDRELLANTQLDKATAKNAELVAKMEMLSKIIKNAEYN